MKKQPIANTYKSFNKVNITNLYIKCLKLKEHVQLSSQPFEWWNKQKYKYIFINMKKFLYLYCCKILLNM